MSPVVNGIGIGPASEMKYAHLRQFLGTWIRIAKGTKKKRDWWAGPVRYFDLHGGDGNGSPKCFLKLAQKHNLPYESYIFEINPDNYVHIENNLNDLFDERTEIIPGNHEHTLWPLISGWHENFKNILGLAFYDPSGTAINFNFLHNFAFKFTRVDILIYMSATNHKRFLHHPRVKKVCDPLDVCINKIPKRHWLIRDAGKFDRHQFIYLFGTQWTNFPELKKIGFVDLNSDEGQQILQTQTLKKHG